MDVLSAIGIEKLFGDGAVQVAALRDVSLTVAAGEFVIVSGPSGSGKSTLLAIMSGLLQPSRGRVEILGRNLRALQRKQLDALRLQEFGFVFQGFHLVPCLNALEQVSLLPIRQGASKAEAMDIAREVLEQVGLSRRLFALPSELSGGEKQRVAVARALAKRPRVIFADEPTSALDSANGSQVVELLRSAALEREVAVVCVTHDRRLMSRATRLVEMEDGRLCTPCAGERSGDEGAAQ